MSLRCLALDATGRKLAIPLRVVSGLEATVTRIRIALETVRGSWPDDTLFGEPYLDWAENPNTPLIEIEGTTRALLAGVTGVLEVLAVNATRVGGDLNISATVRVTDDGDTDVVAQVGDIPDPRVPGAWYLLLPVQTVVP